MTAPSQRLVGRGRPSRAAAVDARRPPLARLSPLAVGAAGKGAELVTLLLLATVVPRVLGPADYGTFAVALNVVTIAAVSMALGGPTLMARFVPVVAAPERAAVARSLGTRMALLRAAQLTVLAVAAVALVAWDPVRFPVVATGLVMLSLVLNVAATLALQTGLGLGRTGLWSLRYPLQNAVLVAAVLALYPVAGTTGAVSAIALSGLVAFALGGVALRPLLGVRPAPALPVGSMRFATLQAVAGGFVQVAHRGGVVAVALLAGSRVQTGFVALALGVALAATYAILQLFTVSLPELAERAGGTAADLEAAEAALRRIAWATLAVVLPAALVIALGLAPAVTLAFGEQFTGAAPAFAQALAFVVLAPANALALQAAALRLRPQASLCSALVQAAVFAGVALAVIPRFGAAGGSGAALAGGAAATLASLRLLPAAIGTRLGAVSLTGAAAVLALAALG